MSVNNTGEGEKLPILILTCQRDSHPFQERTIVVNDVIKVGRSVARVKATDTNAIFDCKVLSRSHALIWHKNGRFWLRDTNSSNGTFVNNTRVVKRPGEECADREIFSGDVIRFGVDVVENETTHGCIIARVTLIQPSGQEAKLTEPIGTANGVMGLETLHSEQVFRLAHFVTEALFREQGLENKLSSMSRLLQQTQEISEAGWQAMLNEERLLHTLDLYESQLSLLKQDLSPDCLQARLCQVIEEKVNVEKASEVTLNRLVKEKTEALSKVTTLECCLSDYERECSRLRQECETTNEAYQAMTRDYNTKLSELAQLEKQVKDVQSEKESLETQLNQRVQEAEALQQKLVLASLANNNPKASRFPDADERLVSSDLNPALNGLENGPLENADYLDVQLGTTELLQSSLNKRAELLREDIAATEQEDRSRLLEIQARLADSEGDLENFVDLAHEGLALQLAHCVQQFNESMRLINSLLDEMNTLFAVNYEAKPPIDANEPTDDQSSSTVPTDIQPPVSRLKDLSAQVTSAHKSLKASLSACCAMQQRLQTSPANMTSGDAVSATSTNQDTSVDEEAVKVSTSASASQTSSEPSTETPIEESKPVMIDSAAQSHGDTTELDRLRADLQSALEDLRQSQQLVETYKAQDAAKAEILLTVREECDVLRKRIAHIEADVVSSREDHQRLVSEARRTRSEAEELRSERDALNAQVMVCTQRIEQLQAALVENADIRVRNGITGDGDLVTARQIETTPQPVVATAGTRSMGATLSLFVVVPVMIFLLALIIYIHSKFAP